MQIVVPHVQSVLHALKVISQQFGAALPESDAGDCMSGTNSAKASTGRP